MYRIAVGVCALAALVALQSPPAGRSAVRSAPRGTPCTYLTRSIAASVLGSSALKRSVVFGACDYAVRGKSSRAVDLAWFCPAPAPIRSIIEHPHGDLASLAVGMLVAGSAARVAGLGSAAIVVSGRESGARTVVAHVQWLKGGCAFQLGASSTGAISTLRVAAIRAARRIAKNAA